VRKVYGYLVDKTERQPFVLSKLAVPTAVTVPWKVEEVSVKKLGVIMWQDEGKTYK